MACSKEFNRKELQSLLSSVLDNLDDGKVKKLSDEQFKALFHFLNGRDTFACLPTGHGKTLIYQIAVFVARTGKVKILPSNPPWFRGVSVRMIARKKFCTFQIFETGVQWKNTQLFHSIFLFVNGLP